MSLQTLVVKLLSQL